MTFMEQTKMTTTHSTCRQKDDLQQRWYDYEAFDEAPIGVMFNVRKLGQGQIQYWMKEKDGRAYSYVKRTDEESLYDAHFRDSGIPSAFKEKGISSFDPKLYEDEHNAQDAVRTAKGYVAHYEVFKKDGMGLMIFSKSEGSGKTHLAIAIVNELMKTYGLAARFIKSIDFFSEMKRNMSIEKYGDPYARSYLFENIKNVPLLLMDDFGAGTSTSYTSDLIYELINTRVQLGKITIYTSKRSFSSLAYDSSILTLIQEKSIPISLPKENIGRQLILRRTKKYEALLNSPSEHRLDKKE